MKIPSPEDGTDAVPAEVEAEVEAEVAVEEGEAAEEATIPTITTEDASLARHPPPLTEIHRS